MIHESTVRRIINDLKRRPEDAAKDLSISEDQLGKILEGSEEFSSELVKRACEVWPVNPGDFYSIIDDCPLGVKVMRAEESKNTSRVMDRAGSSYYEYRDTAMSHVGPFRPEWIKELCVVDNNDPEHPSVQWNNGHFMHQFTYFIGPVNFYFINDEGHKEVAVMNTGDSMYITPFVPHTFTTRQNELGEEGLILALTYGDKLALGAQKELEAMSQAYGNQRVMDFSSRTSAFGGLLRNALNSLSMDTQELCYRTGIDADTLDSYFTSENGVPDYEIISNLAQALGVNSRDLLPPDTIERKVITKQYGDCKPWQFAKHNPYTFRELASTSNLPYSKSLEISFDSTDNNPPELCVPLHQWGYNIGDKEFILFWSGPKSREDVTIYPGDSFYVKPNVRHCFNKTGKALLLRIGGRMAGDAQRELASLGPEVYHRVVSSQQQWFNPEGKQ